MASSLNVVPVPSVHDEDTITRFAYAVGAHLANAGDEVARMQAAVIESATHVDTQGIASAPLLALRALVTGLADGRAKREELDRLQPVPGTLRQRALAYLVRSQRSVRPHELEKILGVQGPQVARELKRLTEDGLVEKLDVADRDFDKRAAHYSATDRGRAAIQHARRLGVPDAEVSSEEVLEAKRRAVRAMLAEAKAARRAGANADETADQVLDRLLTSVPALGDDILSVDTVGEKATSLRQRGVAKQASALLRSPTIASIATSGRPAASYAQARQSYELGKLTMSTPRGAARALVEFQAAETLLDAWPDAALGVWNRLAISECSRLTGDVLSALEFANEAHELATRCDDDFARARSGLHLAFIHRLLGQPTAAISLIDKVERLADKGGYASLLAECNFHRGEALRYKGETEQAFDLLKAASEAMESETRPRRGLAFALSAWGACAFDGGDRKAALMLLRRALEVAESTKAQDAEALTRRRLGVLESARGRNDDANELLLDAHRMYRVAGLESIGQLECSTALAASPMGWKLHGTKALRGAERTLERLTKIDLNQRTGVGPKVERFNLIDRWVFKQLIECAESHADSDVSPAEVRMLWNELHDEGIAPWRNVQHGRSPMGKEPVNVAV